MSYPINFWYGIPKNYINEYRITEAAQAGFNIIECRYDTETNKQVLKWCETHGLKAYLWDDRMYKAIAGEDGWERYLDSMIDEYKDFPALDRYFIKDEPVGTQFPMLERIASYLHEHDKKHGFYINLLPIHAMPEGETYEEHVEDFINMTHPTLLSYDHYCMKKIEADSIETKENEAFFEACVSDECRKRNNTEGIIYKELTTGGYFENLEFIRNKANKYSIDWMIIILLSEHWHYRKLCEAEIRFEVFTALAYGSSQLSYFTYWTPGTAHTEPWSYHHAIISADGEKDENYYIVSRINNEIQTLMQAVGNSKNLEVFHVGSETDPLCKNFTNFEDVRHIGGGKFVAGFFEDGKFILANKDFHFAAYAEISLGNKKLLQKYSKSRKVWENISQNSDCTVFIGAGDGELFRVVDTL